MNIAGSLSRPRTIVTTILMILVTGLCSLSVRAQTTETAMIDSTAELPLDSLGGIQFRQRDLITEDSYFKSEIRSQLVILGDISVERVRHLLLADYDRLKHETDYEFRNKPTGIYIYVYDRPDRRPAGWLGMLTWNDRQWEKNAPSPKSIEPKIYLKEPMIRIFETATGERFGLSELQRVSIWQAFVNAGKLTPSVDVSKTPESIDPLGLGDPSKEIPPSLLDSIKRALANKNGLTVHQIEQIIQEAKEKNWPSSGLDY